MATKAPICNTKAWINGFSAFLNVTVKLQKKFTTMAIRVDAKDARRGVDLVHFVISKLKKAKSTAEEIPPVNTNSAICVESTIKDSLGLPIAAFS